MLERTITQWQFGDWHSLVRLQRSSLQDHSERATLSLFAAAGRLQVGMVHEAKEFIQCARDWGANDKLICRILASNVHNSLARAAAITGDIPRALEHFESAVELAAPPACTPLLLRARLNHQLSELGLNPTHFENVLSVASSVRAHRSARGFSVAKLADIHLGDAWAGNTINTVIFRHHGILTCQGKQITAFYVDKHTLRLARRELDTNVVQTYDMMGEYNLVDAHNSISLGIDRENYIHICYDHHATQLRYRRSALPDDITKWTDELPMTGNAEQRVTYPTFILPHHGFPLTLLYRDGVHDKGVARIKTYDEALEGWKDHPRPTLSGSESRPWTSNAYWNHPVTDKKGDLHLSFVWRTHTLGAGADGLINNINIGYACSPDNGSNWVTSRGREYQLPITQVNAETVHAVSPGSNLINQCSMAVDSANRPHIVFYSDDPNGVPQYQHLRYDGQQWHHQIVSRRAESFSLRGAGTLQIPISRPEIVVDRQDNVYIISRGDHSDGRMVATLLAAPDYRYRSHNTQILWDEDVGFAEPVIDRVRWEQENILSLLLQHNQQPNSDIGHRAVIAPIRVVDIQFLLKY
ncbi:BNR repeat-containing protein [Paraburkholderia sp. ZP32-5]|uniref:BNR repeat-containing protein n=1 Tax=Paraburkholderia sp. ZP32-5 TaxID=2883245 RepID=UPI001F2D2068|nr:BNR repeat-containing protein [Paraburkholderia sp. ZP32-5]